MSKSTDIRPVAAALYLLPVQTRVPLKFGAETLTQVTCARARLTITDRQGRTADGWGETPLSVQWVWPSSIPCEERCQAMKAFCLELAELWSSLRDPGHPIELGYSFQETVLPGWLTGFNQRYRRGKEPLPWLAALLCCSPFDLAAHDAYGQLHDLPAYDTYNARFMNYDLSRYLQAAPRAAAPFAGKYPADFLPLKRPASLMAWHLVGGLDLLDQSELTGQEPDDGFPVLLTDWIQRDGLSVSR
jgi:hypothetical protein